MYNTGEPMIQLTPITPLNSPLLSGGPYTNEAFQNGKVNIADFGLLYGYVYRPVRFTGDENGIMGTSVSHPIIHLPNGKIAHGDNFPWYKTRDEAIKFLCDNKYYGHVKEYVLDVHVLRHEREEVILCRGLQPVKRLCTPQYCIGITDIVNAPHENEFHGHLLDSHNVKVHVRSESFQAK